MKLQSLALAAIVLPLAPAARADVHVVDAAGGGDFTDLQPAIDAAQDGDTLLVKPGTYSRAEIVGKALQVMADSGGIARVVGGMAVRNLLSDQEVVLNRLWIEGDPLGVLDALQVEVALGAVRVERSELYGAASVSDSHAGDAVDASFAEDVALLGTLLLAGNGNDMSPFGSDGGDGVRASGSRVALYDCAVQGGNGGDADSASDFPGRAGHGVRAVDSVVWLSGSSVFGGDGGGDGLFACFPGGDGLRLVGQATTGWLLDSTAQGGTGACGAPAGAATSTSSGATKLDVNGEARSFQPPPVAREGQPIGLVFHGLPGEQVFLVPTAQAMWTIHPTWAGVLLIQLPPLGPRERLGFIGPAGSLETFKIAPTLPAGVEDSVLRWQAFFMNPAGQIRIGGAATRVVIDSSF